MIRRAVLWLCHALSLVCVALTLAGAVRSLAAPAPLERRAGRDASHPAWAAGRWLLNWNGSYYQYDLAEDGTCGAVGTDLDSAPKTCAPSYTGEWAVRNDRLWVREHYVRDVGGYHEFEVPFSGEPAVIPEGGYRGVRVLLARPRPTD